MSEPRREAQRVFLDANVIYGQLTNDIVLSIADRKIIDPRWSEHVLAAAVHSRSDVLVTVKAMGDRSPRSIALDGVAQAQGATTPPASTPTVQTRSPYEKIPGLKKGPQTER